jgi:hypothetical protein
MSKEDVKIAHEVSQVLPSVYDTTGIPLMGYIKVLGIRPSSFFLELSKRVKVGSSDKVFAEAADMLQGSHEIVEQLLEEEYEKAIETSAFS